PPIHPGRPCHTRGRLPNPRCPVALPAVIVARALALLSRGRPPDLRLSLALLSRGATPGPPLSCGPCDFVAGALAMEPLRYPGGWARAPQRAFSPGWPC